MLPVTASQIYTAVKAEPGICFKFRSEYGISYLIEKIPYGTPFFAGQMPIVSRSSRREGILTLLKAFSYTESAHRVPLEDQL